MMRWITLFIFFHSVSAPASQLAIGSPFNHCDNSGNVFHQDYYIEFMKDGTEFEAEIYLSPGKLPCGGEHLFTIGRTWNYEVYDDEFFSVLKEVVVTISHSRMIPFFNKHKFCDYSDWKVDALVNCTGKNIFGHEHLFGHRTFHQFQLLRNELQVFDQSGTKLILRKFRK